MLQMTFDTIWICCKIMGLDMRVKGKKKTAFMATQWRGDQQVDVTGVDMWLGPERAPIPQITMDELPSHEQLPRERQPPRSPAHSRLHFERPQSLGLLRGQLVAGGLALG